MADQLRSASCGRIASSIASTSSSIASFVPRVARPICSVSHCIIITCVHVLRLELRQNYVGITSFDSPLLVVLRSRERESKKAAPMSRKAIGRLDKPRTRRQNSAHKNSSTACLIPRTPPCLEFRDSPCATRLKSGSIAASSAGSAVTAGAFLAERVGYRAVTSAQPAFTECERWAAWAIGRHSAGQSLAAHFWKFRGFFPNLEKTFPTTRAVVGRIQVRQKRWLVEQPAKDNQRRAMRILIVC